MAIRNNNISSRKIYIGTGTEVVPNDGDALISGNVGVGTTSPDSKLHVELNSSGATPISQQQLILENNTATGIAILTPSTTSGYLFFGDNNDAQRGYIVYSHPTDEMKFKVAGSERMIVNSSGNVGIGTTSPQSKLDVKLANNSTANIGGTISVGAFAGLSFGYSEVGNSNYRHSAIVFERDDAAFGDARGKVHILNSSSGSTSADLGDARLTILPSGNVGIGTTDPLRKLHVVGNFAVNSGTGEYYGVNITGGEGASPNILIGDWHNSSANIKWDSSGNYLRIDAQHSTSGAPIVFSGNDSAIEYMRITSAGNVGIGVTSPSKKLHVAGDTQIDASGLGQTLLLGRANGQPSIKAQTDNGGHMIIDSTTNFMSLNHYVNQNIAMVMGGGNVGIGTSSPASKLHINSSGDAITFERSGQETYKIIHGTSGLYFTKPNSAALGFGITQNSDFDIFDSGSSVMFRAVSSSGNVGIGTTSPSSKLTVSSSIGADGSWNKSGILIENTSTTTGEPTLSFRNAGTAGTGANYWHTGLNQSNVYKIAYGTSFTDGNTKFELSTNGALRLNSYTQGFLQTDANGNIGLTGGGTLPGGPYLPLAGGTMDASANINMNSGTLSSVDFIDFGIGQLNGVSTSNLILKSLGDITYNVDSNNNGNSSHIFQESGSELMRIRYDGNVGIGTTSPDSPLEVQFDEATGTAKQMLHLDYNPTNNYGSAVIKISGGNTSGASTEIEQVTGGGAGSFGTYIDTNVINRGLSSGAFGNINFVTGSSTSTSSIVMTIGGGSQKGNVGIGTTNPGAKLQVGTGSGAAVDTAYQIVADGSAISGIQILSGTNHSGRLVFGDSDNNDIGIIKYDHSDNSLQTIVNASEKTRVTSTGILMVGGTTGGYAGTKIHVGNFTDTQNGINILSSTTGYGYLLFGDGTGADTYRGQITYYHGDDSMIFNTNGSEKLRIVSGGGISFAGATNFGSAGQVLKSNGSASPAWVDASTVIGGPYLPLAGGTMTGDTKRGDNIYSYWGDSDDLAIYHLNGASSIYDRGAGNLNIFTNGGSIGLRKDSGENMLIANIDGSVDLYYDNSKKLATTSAGVNVTGEGYSTGGWGFGTGETPVGKIFNNSGVFAVRAETGRQISFGNVTNGEFMRINATGNVGIGTTSPRGKLQINGNGNAWNEAPSVRLWDTTNGKGWLVGNVNNYTAGDFYIRTFASVNVDPTSASQEFTIKHATGNVGIGTTSPSNRLQVSGGSIGIDSEYMIRDNRNNTILLQSASTAASNRSLTIGNATYSNVIVPNGNVGIGTTSPSEKLHVFGGAAAIEIDSTTNEAALKYDNSTTTATIKLANNDLKTELGGSEKMRITSSGDVGIGTTSPSEKLTVIGGAASRPTFVHQSGYGGIQISGSAAGSSAALIFSNDYNNVVSPEYTILMDGASDSLVFISGDPGDVATQEKMRITSAGNVGIGTTTPGYKLDINGSLHSTNLTIADVIYHEGDTNTYMQFHAADQWRVVTGGNERLEVNNSQVTVANNLQVNGSIYTSQYIYHTGDTNTYMRFPSNDTISWNTAGSERMRINSSGNIGIGTTAPTYKLHVAGTTYANGSTIGSSDLLLKDTASAYSTELKMQNNTHTIGIDYQNNEQLRFITRSGTTTVPITFQMRAGTITAANFILSSDERKKTKIVDLTCDNVDVSWKSFEMKDNEGEYRTGVIAQELEQKHPEFVNTDEEGFKTVKYIDLLIAKIAELEARLEKVENN